ncbi:hypothetical protein UY3_16012 [Chelonia mydas]|uniref:Uncharacterized protein n=1 Tax=Chelonia mydas TaxID=8469 RepID=M7AV97_CHEMY|nr:hypothetical protein UY3_16012 [Chelonia mydas]
MPFVGNLNKGIKDEMGVLTHKGVVGGGPPGYSRGACGTATFTSALLLEAALPSELGSWEVVAAGREPSSEGSAEVRMAWYGIATLTSELLPAKLRPQSGAATLWLPSCEGSKTESHRQLLTLSRVCLKDIKEKLEPSYPSKKKQKDFGYVYASDSTSVHVQVTSEQYPQKEEGALEQRPELKIILQSPVLHHT